MKKFYKVSDWINAAERKRFDLSMKESTYIGVRVIDGIMIRAELTGEKRSPKRGEWYISGSTPVAYRAPKDFNEEYYIAKLVKLRQETTVNLYRVF